MASTRAWRSTSLTLALSTLTLPLRRRSLFTAGRTLSASSRGTLTRTVSPLASVLMTRTCSQRSLDADAVDCVELAGAAVDCARAPSGDARRIVAVMRAVFANKILYLSDMTGCLLDG